MAILVSTRVAKEICDVLGLKDVKSLTLHFAVNSVATAEVVFRPNENQVSGIVPLLKKYHLTEIPE